MVVEIKEAKKSGLGCWGYGCIISLVLLIALAVGIYLFVTRMVNAYTTTTPLPLPKIELKTGSYEDAKLRLGSFILGLQTGNGAKELRLTGDDINALIAQEPDWQALRDHAFVEIKGDKVYAKLNVSLEELGFKSRYFNGDAVFGLNYENGLGRITPVKLTVNGLELGEEILKPLVANTFSIADVKDEKKRADLEKIEFIKLENNQLVITRK